MFNGMCRYVATELATDIVVNVGDVKFYLHKVRQLLRYDIKFEKKEEFLPFSR